MSCKECGRPSPSALCSGCRTLGRIDTLWRDLDEKDLPLGLGFLRECAGALTDLAEARWAERQAKVPLKSGETPPVTGETPGSAGTVGGEAAPKEKPTEEKGPTREPHQEVKEEALASDRGEGEPEESYSYETGEEEPAAEEKAEPKSVDRTKTHPNAHKIQKGNLSKPLGLRPLPVKLSRRDPEPEEPKHDDGDRGRERKVHRTEEDRAQGSRPSHGRPSEPSYPPPGRGSGKERHRSRSRKRRRAKGKKKRERGEEWRRQHHRWQEGWRRK